LAGWIAYGALVFIFGSLAWVVFYLFEPRDPRSRREEEGIVREKWHSPASLIVAQMSIGRTGPCSYYCPESWWMAVEINGQVMKASDPLQKPIHKAERS
jgi:hypothetical protein